MRHIQNLLENYKNLSPRKKTYIDLIGSYFFLRGCLKYFGVSDTSAVIYAQFSMTSIAYFSGKFMSEMTDLTPSSMIHAALNNIRSAVTCSVANGVVPEYLGNFFGMPLIWYYEAYQIGDSFLRGLEVEENDEAIPQFRQ